MLCVCEREHGGVLSPHSKRRTSRKQGSKVNSRELVCNVYLWVNAGLFLYPEFTSLNLLGKGKKNTNNSLKLLTIFVLTLRRI